MKVKCPKCRHINNFKEKNLTDGNCSACANCKSKIFISQGHKKVEFIMTAVGSPGIFLLIPVYFLVDSLLPVSIINYRFVVNATITIGIVIICLWLLIKILQSIFIKYDVKETDENTMP